MDGQEQIAGASAANSPESGLDERSAFSVYTEAIDYISHQYSLWEDAQNEFRNCEEIYRTAKALEPSIGYKISEKACNCQSHNALLSFSILSQEKLGYAVQKFDEIKQLNSQIDLETQQNSKKLIQLREDHDKALLLLESQSKKTLERISKITRSQPKDIESLKEELKSDQEKIDQQSYPGCVAGVIISVIFLYTWASLALKYFHDSNPHPNIGSILFSIIVSVTGGFIASVFFLSFCSLVLSPLLFVMGKIGEFMISDIKTMPEKERKRLDEKLKNLIQKQIEDEALLPKMQDYISSIAADKRKLIAQLNTNESQQISERDNIISDINNSIAEIHLDCFDSICQIYCLKKLAKKSALEITPIDFRETIHNQRVVLGQVFEYWEHGELVQSFSRMLARPWEDNAWFSSYQPQIGTQLPDCVRIGNYLIDQINPETNQIISPMQVPAMIPVRAIKPKSQARLPGHIVIFSNKLSFI
jgi:hypothetical protein